MADYTYCQWCLPAADRRIQAMVGFAEVMRDGLGVKRLYDTRSRPLDLTPESLAAWWEKGRIRGCPHLGALVHLYTPAPRRRDPRTVRLECATGAAPTVIHADSFTAFLGPPEQVPAVGFLRRSIEVVKPFFAFLAETSNEEAFSTYTKEKAAKDFTKPCIIRGFQYLHRDVVARMGGMEHALAFPLGRVEEFCEGILIQLVPVLFDPGNPEHLRIQREAIRYWELQR